MEHVHLASELDKAYAAGFIDGEGTITTDVSGSRKTGCSLRVIVSNTDIAILRWLQDTWGGKTYLRPANNSRSKPFGRWQAVSRVAHKFLIDILPYLKVKRRHAEIGLSLKGYLRPNRDPEAQMAVREALAALNVRGS